MHISELVFKKKKIFYFLLVAIIFGGVFSFKKISKLEDPEIVIMVANVVTVYPGASAHDVELQVTSVLEEEISALADLKSIKSKSDANISVIEVQLKTSVPQKEIPQRWEFLRRKLDIAMTKMPDGVETPMVIDDMGDVYGMFYAMIADDGYSYKEMNNYADLIRRNMLEVDGVKKVSIYGEQSPEIFVTLSADKMSEMGVMPMQIFSALNSDTEELYAGSMISGNQQMRVSLNEKARSVEDIKNIIISGASGNSFKLGDIARIEKGYNEPLRNTMFINNHKAIGVAMSMESGENILEVGKSVEARLEELKRQIPEGITFEKVFFQPEKVEAAVNGFTWNLVMSVAIVIIVLMLTMGLSGGVIIGSGLALTILATFPVLMSVDGSLQRISLGAFIVAMGMLVDNAIVVLDGILIEKSKGRFSKSAFTKTAKQTAMPLLGATTIAIATFFPVFLSTDTAGTYMRDLFVVIAISLSISWLLALTQVPLFASIFYTKSKKGNKPAQSNSDIYDKPIYRAIRKVIEKCMHKRGLVIIASAALLVVAMMGMKNVNQTFFPNFDYNQMYIEYTLPYGSTPDMVNDDLKQITDHLNTYDEVEMVLTSHGMTPMRYILLRGMMTENADNYGELIVNFEDYETAQKMRPIFNEYLRTEFPEATSRIRNYNMTLASTHSVEAVFSGPDPAVLKQLSRQVQDMMLQNPNVDKYTVCDDWEPKAKSLTALYDPIAGDKTSITRSDANNAILSATDGLPIAAIYEGETKIPVRFRVRDINGNRIEDLSDIPTWPTMPNIGGSLDMGSLMGLASGSVNIDDMTKDALTAVPLSAVTNGVDMGWEEPVVRRLNGTRVIRAKCDPLDSSSPAEVEGQLDELVTQMQLPEGYSFKWGGESEMSADGLGNIIANLPIAVVVILLVLLALFNDYRRPLIVILCLPMAVIGIAPGLLITGQPLSLIAIVGIIGLVGMIIKNAIVLLDEIQIRLKVSTTPYQAVVDATISRVRPVVMASATTILGMIPLLTDPMYAAMAVAIMSGLMAGTLITLLFVPILYSAFFMVKIDK